MKTLRFSIVDTETGETLVGSKNVYIDECDHEEKKMVKREPRRCSIVKSVVVDGVEVVNNTYKKNNKLSKKEKNNFKKNTNRNDQRKDQKVKVNFKDNNKKVKNVKLGMSNKDKQKGFKEDEKITVKVGSQKPVKPEPVVEVKDEIETTSSIDKYITEPLESSITLEQILYGEPNTDKKSKDIVNTNEDSKKNIIAECEYSSIVDLIPDPNTLVEESENDIIEEPEKTIEEEVLGKQQPPRKKKRSRQGKYVSPEQLVFGDEVQNQVEELVASQLDSIPGVNLCDVQEQIDSVFDYYDEYEDAPSRQKIVKGNKGGDK